MQDYEKKSNLRFQKFISTLLHPIVIPTVSVVLFLLYTPQIITKERQYLLLAVVFIATYIIPLIALVLLKAFGIINSYNLISIKERKIPIFLMLIIFYFLGWLLHTIPVFQGLGMLFFGINLALLVVYFLFILDIKVSLHIMSLSSVIGFFLIFGATNLTFILPLVAILILVTGLLASARLHLKAHNKSEIYLGFFIGLTSQFAIYYIL